MLPCAAVATRIVALTVSAGTTGDVLYLSCWKIRNPALGKRSWQMPQDPAWVPETGICGKGPVHAEEAMTSESDVGCL